MITFLVPKDRFDHPNEDHGDYIAERIAAIFEGSDARVFGDEDSHDWSLGISNNWWIQQELKSQFVLVRNIEVVCKQFTIKPRYPIDSNLEMALKTVIVYILGIKEFN